MDVCPRIISRNVSSEKGSKGKSRNIQHTLEDGKAVWKIKGWLSWTFGAERGNFDAKKIWDVPSYF